MTDAGGSEAAAEHYSPAVRLCEVLRPASGGSCGFHLSRTKWDPYPWVSVVEGGSAAHQAGLQVGDCLLEVNGEDVVGQKIGEIADRVRSRPDCASLLVWNCGADDACDPEALCCGPMPVSLKRLSSCLGAVLGALECPVCLDTIPPPAHQCGNGHLLCAGCRARAERCPVCRVRLCRGRSLLADQVFQALTDTFNVNEVPREEQSATLRQRLLVLIKKRDPRPAPELKVSFTASNKFLTKLMGKSSSLNNLATTDEEPVRLSAVPRHLSVTPEFNAELKVKSLSTSEISRPSTSSPTSPAPSRAPSPAPSPGSRSPNIQRASAKRFGSGLLDAGHLPLGSASQRSRPASCHGSVESLFESEAAEGADLESQLFRCPWSASCSLTLPSTRIVSHGRAHGGPLLLAFRAHLELAVPLAGPLCVQLLDPAGQPREIFVDTHRGASDHLYLRAWLAAAADDCRSWRLSVTVLPADGRPHLVRLQSLSVEAPDPRQHQDDPGVDARGGADGGDEEAVRDAASTEPTTPRRRLRLPADAARVGLDFAADPLDDALRPGGAGKGMAQTAALVRSLNAVAQDVRDVRNGR